jgi:hypothetical protein
MLISPEVSDLTNGLNQIRFKAAGLYGGELFEIGTMSDPTDASTYTTFKTIELTDTYDEYNVYFSAQYTDGNNYIVFKHGNDGTDNIYIDDFEYMPSPSCIAVSDILTSNITAHEVDLAWTEQGSASAWEYVVQAAGTGEPVAAGISVAITSASVSGLSGETDYEVYVRTDCTGGDFSTWVGPVNFTTLVACPQPSGLSAVVTMTSANVDWTEEGSATTWNIEWGEDGYTQGSGIGSASTIVKPYEITDLSDNTAYDFYVQSSCGGSDGDSNWTGPFSFTTLCSSQISYPFMEGFEDLVEPACWSEERTGTTYGWSSNSGGYVDNCARFDSYYNQSGNTSSMFTKTFDLTSLADPQLSFYFKNPTGGDFTVSISSDGGASYTVLETNLTGQADWVQKTYDLTSHISDNVIIEFKGTSNYGSGDAYVYLDNVEVTYTTLSIANTSIEGFNMYPNPVTNTLNLNAQEQIDAVSIYNMLGQEVLRNTPSATQVQLDMSTLSTGAYIVKVQAGNQLGSYNLIKQ